MWAAFIVSKIHGERAASKATGFHMACGQDGNSDESEASRLFLRKNHSHSEPVLKSLHFMWATKCLHSDIPNSLIKLLSYCSLVLTFTLELYWGVKLLNGRKACHICREMSAKIPNDKTNLRNRIVHWFSGEGITTPTIKVQKKPQR